MSISPDRRYRVMAVEPGHVVLYDTTEKAIVTLDGVSLSIVPLPGRRRRKVAPAPADPRQAVLGVEPEIATPFGDDFSPAPGLEDAQL